MARNFRIQEITVINSVVKEVSISEMPTTDKISYNESLFSLFKGLGKISLARQNTFQQ